MPKTQVVIEVEGGCVSSVYCSDPSNTQVFLVDWDIPEVSEDQFVFQYEPVEAIGEASEETRKALADYALEEMMG